MVRIVFTPNIQRHIACPPCAVAGRTVGEALAAVFAANERARGYILDERGALRKHMMIYINGEPINDRESLGDPVSEGSEIAIFQALSGG
jgi:sulfur-carrier protein